MSRSLRGTTATSEHDRFTSIGAIILLGIQLGVEGSVVRGARLLLVLLIWLGNRREPVRLGAEPYDAGKFGFLCFTSIPRCATPVGGLATFCGRHIIHAHIYLQITQHNAPNKFHRTSARIQKLNEELKARYLDPSVDMMRVIGSRFSYIFIPARFEALGTAHIPRRVRALLLLRFCCAVPRQGILSSRHDYWKTSAIIASRIASDPFCLLG
ncbi:hypothetical protein B0H11DRAFT_449976 [Mycena galericulata]|nr:hypothetical protein B0H11DRAFT_449976 [Mycena galericulata]